MRPEFLLPFPVRTGEPARAARRAPSLSGKRVALVDNSRVTYPAFVEIGEVLREALEAQGATVVPLRYELLPFTEEQIRDCARTIASHDVVAAVVALAEAGITQATVGLAVVLESSGIPTVTLCTDPGVALARAVASASMPDMPLVDLGIERDETPAEVGNRARAAIAAVVAGITTTPPKGDDSLLFPRPASVEAAWQASSREEDPGEAALAFLRACEEARIGDGLPVVPPTRRLVDAMLAAGGVAPGNVIAPPTPPSGAAITAELAAVNAVMAGCEPAHFPVVIAALRAMSATRYRLLQAAITTHPGTNLILVSGPLAKRAGVSADGGCLGPGQRANLSIGRAVNLCVMNVLRSLPGITDLGTLGSAAEIATCLADKPCGAWPALHETLAGPHASTVTVHRCAAPHNVVDLLSDTPEGILSSVAAAATSIACNNAYLPAEMIVILAPDHARVIDGGGWTRADVQHFLFQHVRNRRDRLEGRGVLPIWPKWFETLEDVPVVHRPEDILVVVAGGPGQQSQVALPWGLSRASTTVV